MATENKFSTLLVYGATGTGKTREIGALSWDIWKRYGKRTRLISADGGGWGSIQDYVDSGLIEAINISDAETPLTLLRMLARGDWPERRIGQGPLGWTKREKQANWDEIGMYAIEGFSSIAHMILRDQVNKGRKISEEVVGKFVEEDSETGEKFTFGAAGRSHYGFTHGAILELIKGFQGLLNHGVRQIVFTSLESTGEDSITKRKILGPASVGSAITEIIPQRVGDMIHLDIAAVPDGKGQREEYRAYYTNHVDPEINRAWPAKLRLGPEASAAAAKSPEFKKGYIVLGGEDDQGIEREGIAKLLKWRDEMAGGGAEKLRQLMNNNNNNQTKELANV